MNCEGNGKKWVWPTTLGAITCLEALSETTCESTLAEHSVF